MSSDLKQKTIKWDYRMMDLADHIAQWSKDPNTRVGAVITDSACRVIGMGYNGFPRGVRDDFDRYQDKEQKYSYVVHAELNAILNATIKLDTDYTTLYTTLSPCRECAKAIIQAGIHRVVFKEYRSDPFTNVMFSEAGVVMDKVGMYGV
jgi:dCMP deaminase